MVSLEDIAETYRAMPDDLLLHFFKTEGSHLRPDALRLLLTEMRNRKIEWTQQAPGIEHIEITSEQETACLQTLTYLVGLHHPASHIRLLLLEQEFSEEAINLAFEKLSAETKKNLPRAAQHKLTGSLLFMSGLSVLFLPLVAHKHLVIYIVAYLLMIVGALRWIHGSFIRHRYSRLLKQLEASE